LTTPTIFTPAERRKRGRALLNVARRQVVANRHRRQRQNATARIANSEFRVDYRLRRPALTSNELDRRRVAPLVNR
jgi:hypothetical protein